MIIQHKILKRGFSINLLKNSRLKYPLGIWENLSMETKQTLTDNLTYLKVSPYAMFLDKEMHFDFSLPYLKEMGDKGVLADIPKVADEDGVSSGKLIEAFTGKKTKFRDENIKLLDENSEAGSILGLSFGKDSLLSYGVMKEIDVKTNLVFVQDCWDTESMHKLLLIQKFEQEFGERIELMYDEFDNISCHKEINPTNSEGIVGSNAMNGYLVMIMPFAFFHKADSVIFGNEQNFNDYFINKEGLKVYPSYEQSSEWMVEQNKALTGFTNGQMKVRSLIEPLYNIAEVKVLFNRYPKIAKYQMSCSLSNTNSKKERWCYNCPMCAKAYLYLKACGVDPKVANLNLDMFGKGYETFYPLFVEPKRAYERPKAVRDEQLFAFYLAYKNKCTGYLIDKFKELFLNEAKEREDELYNKFFGVHHPLSIPQSVYHKLKSIFKEELGV